MKFLDTFFGAPVAFGISGLMLFLIGLLIRQNQGRRWVLTLSMFLYVRYMLWRLFYTIPTVDSASMTIGWITILAELYGLCQFCFFTYQSWSPTERKPAPPYKVPHRGHHGDGGRRTVVDPSTNPHRVPLTGVSARSIYRACARRRTSSRNPEIGELPRM